MVCNAPTPSMDSTTITHTNGTKITTVSTAEPRPLATKISGTAISKQLREELKLEVQALQSEHSVTPGLAVVLVGDRPDSATYVRMKKKAAAEIGFHSVDVTMPDTSTTVLTQFLALAGSTAPNSRRRLLLAHAGRTLGGCT